MKIKNRKTGLLYDVSKEEWEGMHERQESRRYDIIDSSDESLLSEEIKVEPINLMGQDDDMAEKSDNTYEDVDEEAEYIRDQLKGAGIYFHPNTGIEKLRQKYLELTKQ